MRPVKLSLLIIIIASFALVCSWFREGLVLGTAESEIPFYRLESQKLRTQWAWADLWLGNPSGITLTAAPMWGFLAALQNIGIPGFLLQAGFFWFLFVVSGLAIYHLTKTLFPDVSKKYLLLATFFYWFNPLSLVVVWNRFLYTHMVFFAALPLVMLLFIWGLEKKKFLFGILTALVLTLFSYSLTYVFAFLSWSVLAFCCLFYILSNWKKQFSIFAVSLFSFTLILFLIMNTWWLLPTIGFLNADETSQGFSFFTNTAVNVQTLTILSRKLGNLIDIIRFFQVAFFNGEGPAWGTYVNFPVINILLFIVPAIILWGIYKLRNDRKVLFLATLLIFGIFLAKGNNPPFGNIFEFFFKQFGFLQIFRDPFEKFAFIISLAASPLVAVAAFNIFNPLKGGLKKISYILIILIMGIFSIPYFGGLVFMGVSPPSNNYDIGYKVKIPDYYKEANAWLESQGKNFRFISFPLGDEGITFNWEKGYQGVEPSQILFSTPGITFNTTIPYYSQIVSKLESLLFEGDEFFKVANSLNVRYFILRGDVDISERRLRKLQVLEALLVSYEEKGLVKNVAQFGQLQIWENLKWEDRTIYIGSNLMVAFPQSQIAEVLLPQATESAVLSVSNEMTRKKARLEVIYPQENNIQYIGKQRCIQQIPALNNPRNYTFTVPENSEYELLLADIRLFEDEASLSAKLRIKIDDKFVESEGAPNKNMLFFGKILLGAGMHTLSIESPMTPNLISALESFGLGRGQNEKLFKIENFNPYSRYLVNFDYKSNGNLTLIFHENNILFRDGRFIPECWNADILAKSLFDFTHFENIYIPERSEEAGILFWVNPNEGTEASIKNLSVNRLIEPKPILIKENPNKVQVSLPKIQYIKHNPTKYSVKVEGSNGSFALVLSQLFNSGWQAKYDDQVILDTHFLANAYANGWVIEKKGDFNLTLEFAPQQLLDKGKIISGITIIGALIYIGSRLLRKKLWK